MFKKTQKLMVGLVLGVLALSGCGDTVTNAAAVTPAKTALTATPVRIVK